VYDRLTKIDELTRPDHTFLEATDSCFFLGEYTARGGYAAGATNNLINNLKKPMSYRNRPDVWQYKSGAIASCAEILRVIMGQGNISRLTFIPVPPSRAKSDPDYDDRLLQILIRMTGGIQADIRELIVQSGSLAASHEGDRTSIADLVKNYEVVEALKAPEPAHEIIIFDDVLTTGRHFKAMQQVLRNAFPTIKCSGLFIARRVPQTSPQT
jgi:predicted amidophosphoribosyltransferase